MDWGLFMLVVLSGLGLCLVLMWVFWLGEEMTETEYKLALARIEELMDAEDDTLEGDELERLVTLVEAYEDEHYPIP